MKSIMVVKQEFFYGYDVLLDEEEEVEELSIEPGEYEFIPETECCYPMFNYKGSYLDLSDLQMLIDEGKVEIIEK